MTTVNHSNDTQPFFILFLSSLLGWRSALTAAELPVEADSYISLAAPSENFGGSDAVASIDSSTGGAFKGYLRFNASALPQPVPNVTALEMVYARPHSRPAAFYLLTGPNADDWEEYGITADNAPANLATGSGFIPSEVLFLGQATGVAVGETIRLELSPAASRALTEALNSGDRRARTPSSIERWSEPHHLTSGLTYPSILIDPADNLHLFARDHNGHFTYDRMQADGSWEPRRTVVMPTLRPGYWTGITDYVVTFDQAGDAYILMAATDEADSRWYLMHSRDRSRTWTPYELPFGPMPGDYQQRTIDGNRALMEQHINQAGFLEHPPVIALHSRGTIHYLLGSHGTFENPQETVTYARSLRPLDISAFTEQVRLPAPGCTYPAIAIDSQDTLHVVTRKYDTYGWVTEDTFAEGYTQARRNPGDYSEGFNHFGRSRVAYFRLPADGEWAYEPLVVTHFGGYVFWSTCISVDQNDRVFVSYRYSPRAEQVQRPIPSTLLFSDDGGEHWSLAETADFR